MPVKPAKDETDSDFMSRCVPEMMGAHGGTKRPQEQAVAACLSILREHRPGSAPPAPEKTLKADDDDDGDKPYGDVEYADPGYQSDKKKRYPIDTVDHIKAAWNYINKAENQKPYSADQVDKIKARIIAAWKKKIDAAGPPSAQEDKSYRKQNGAGDDMDCDPPGDDESHDDFMERCADSMDEDSCQMMWEDAQQERAGRAPVRKALIRKTHSGDAIGLEFVLSDESIDRMGDVIMSTGWVLDNFKKHPIALFNHNADFPIGKWHNLRVENGSLRGHLQLAKKGTSARINEILSLVEQGILQAVSVGFHPIEDEPLKAANGGWAGSRFTKQELIETSLVSVPANPNALAVAKSLGVSPGTLDVIFAKHGNQADIKRRDFTAKHGDTSRNGKGSQMPTLSQRILDLQQQIANKVEELDVHIGKMDDSNVSDTDLDKQKLLNAQIKQLRETHAALVESEERLQSTATDGTGNTGNNGNNDTRRRSLTPAAVYTHAGNPQLGAPLIVKPSKRDWEPLEYLVHAGVCVGMAKIRGTLPDIERMRIYGDDEEHKVVLDWVMRAASAPAFTTVAGWAQELVQQIYADLLSLLMPQSVFPRLAAKGTTLSFGQAGKILLPARSRTPTIAGSFVGEGMAIPVRQGAFTSQTFTPKKMAVITTWTREMADHSIPAIEGVLRQAIQEDTAVSMDAVLLDANPATTIRPAGMLNGVVALPATAGPGMAALIGDIKQLVQALVVTTYGNIRSPVWLMNPGDVLTASLEQATNTGIFPFKDEIARGTLNNIPIIDSATVPSKTVVIADAADFVVMQADTMRFEMSDQATLHMEDTTPLDLVSGSPGTVASPQRSLFQTDSLALRMIFPVNWSFRRTGMVAWTQNINW
jgi:HK97 family phage prohead protease/HK97 family phage major capsid protein